MNVLARNLHRLGEAFARIARRGGQVEAAKPAIHPPRTGESPFEVEAATLQMMDAADANLKAGRWSKPADLEKYAKYGE